MIAENNPPQTYERLTSTPEILASQLAKLGAEVVALRSGGPDSLAQELPA